MARTEAFLPDRIVIHDELHHFAKVEMVGQHRPRGGGPVARDGAACGPRRLEHVQQPLLRLVDPPRIVFISRQAVEAAVFFIATTIALSNLVVDVLQMLIDPRIRRGCRRLWPACERNFRISP